MGLGDRHCKACEGLAVSQTHSPPTCAVSPLQFTGSRALAVSDWTLVAEIGPRERCTGRRLVEEPHDLGQSILSPDLTRAAVLSSSARAAADGVPVEASVPRHFLVDLQPCLCRGGWGILLPVPAATPPDRAKARTKARDHRRIAQFPWAKPSRIKSLRQMLTP